MTPDQDSGTSRRGIGRSLAAACGVVAVVAGLGACSGDDSGAAVQLPTGADDVVLWLGHGPLPTMLIAGDGTVYELAAEPLSNISLSNAPLSSDQLPNAQVPSVGRPTAGSFGRSRAGGMVAIAPAPAAPAPMVVRQLTDEGLQRVFARAEELGMLDTPPDYADVNVTDSGSTYLELRDADGTYEHVAYALGYDDEEVDADRQAFVDMVRDLADLDHLAGRGNISDPEPYEPSTYLVTADDVFAPSGQRWPAGVPLEEGCVQLPLDRFPDGAAGTYLYDAGGEDDGTTALPARVWVVPDLPGDDC